MVPEILMFLLIFFALFYLIAGIISIWNIIKYKNLATELDEEVIAHSPFQPSISLVVNLDLRKADIQQKIESLLKLHYRNYDIIAVCNSIINPKEFEDLVDHFHLIERRNGLYASKDTQYVRLLVADRHDLHRVRNKLKYGVSLSKKNYIIPIYDIDHRLRSECLVKPATLLMRSPDGRPIRMTGAWRYVTEGNIFDKNFLVCADLNNLRRIYLNGNVCDRNNQRGLKLFGRIPVKGTHSEFIPEPMMYVKRPDNLSTYMEVLASGITDKKMCRLIYNLSELIIAALFLVCLVMIIVPTPDNKLYLTLVLSTFLLVLLCNTFAVYIMEVIMPETIDFKKVGRLLLMSFVESIMSLILIIPAWIMRGTKLLKINLAVKKSN